MEVSATVLILAALVTIVAGFVKGAVGFALPMIMISGLGSLMSAELALATLILPTLVSNFLQAVRDGLSAAWSSARLYWRYIAIVAIFIALSAQLVMLMPQRAMLMVIGFIVVAFCAAQLAGVRPRIRAEARGRAEVLIGSLAGALGGVSGVWGPPTVMYLTAVDAPKRESIRVQGVVYLLGSVTLAAAHIQSGILDAGTAPLSALMIVPAAIGMAVGQRFQDRLDPERFRRATLAVLVLAGLNLIRRAIF